MAGELRIAVGRHGWLLMAFLLGFIGLVGCGSAGPDVQMISGVVTLDGRPVNGATVIFVPEADGLMAAGRTNAEGLFVLNASVGKKFGRGTTEGDYIVTLSKLTNVKIDPITGEPTDIQLAEPQELIPRIYTTAADSPLRATVIKGLNEYQFNLKKQQ